MKWVRENKRILRIQVFLFGSVSLYFLAHLNSISFLAFGILLIASVVSFLYVLRIKGRTLREAPYIKSHLIAFSWVVVIVLFPVVNEEKEIPILFVALAHYLYTIAATIPFDIRDLKFDSPSQKTIPQVLGVLPSKIVAGVLFFGFAGLMVLSFPELGCNYLFYIAIFVQITLLVLMDENRSDLYCAGLVDGAIALVGVSYFIA